MRIFVFIFNALFRRICLLSIDRGREDGLLSTYRIEIIPGFSEDRRDFRPITVLAPQSSVLVLCGIYFPKLTELGMDMLWFVLRHPRCRTCAELIRIPGFKLRVVRDLLEDCW